jgi:hypothetical protein
MRTGALFARATYRMVEGVLVPDSGQVTHVKDPVESHCLVCHRSQSQLESSRTVVKKRAQKHLRSSCLSVTESR